MTIARKKTNQINRILLRGFSDAQSFLFLDRSNKSLISNMNKICYFYVPFR